MKNFILLMWVLLPTLCLSQGFHLPLEQLPVSNTPNYSFVPNYRQNVDATSANSTPQNGVDLDIFVNFTFDTSNDEIFVVYTTDGTTPNKSNGTVVTGTFSSFEDPNRVWVGTISGLMTNDDLQYIIYSNSLDDNSNNLASANNRISPNGFENTWDENDGSAFSVTVVLPIKLASFEVTKNELGSAELVWVSESECEASHYIVERSLDGINFEELSIVPTIGGGTNCDGATYSYSDFEVSNQIRSKEVFYRLRMVDLDDSFEHTDLKKIDGNLKLFTYFDQASKQLRVENFESIYRIQIVSLDGVTMMNTESSDEVQDLNQLDKGFYIISIYTQTGNVSEKIVIN